MTALLDEITAAIRDVFGDPSLTLSETSTAADVEGWDSLMHLNVVIELERRFRVRFSTAEISNLKEEGQNIGALARLIASKQDGRA